MEQEQSKTRIVVLLDGDNTTWAPNAAIIDVPNDVYRDDILAAGDSKLLRRYIEGAPTAKGALWVLELIAEVLYPDGADGRSVEFYDYKEALDKIDSLLKDYGLTPKGKAGG